MKKIKLILSVSMVLLFGINSITNAEVPASKETVSHYLQSKVYFPSHLLNDAKEDFVMVTLAVNDEGKIQVLESNSENEKLKSYLVNRLSKVKADTSILEGGKTYSVKFKFQVIE